MKCPGDFKLRLAQRAIANKSPGHYFKVEQCPNWDAASWKVGLENLRAGCGAKLPENRIPKLDFSVILMILLELRLSLIVAATLAFTIRIFQFEPLI